ncbi:MAG TPA: NifU family protein [Gaiellaceae bacterium]|nr:NifU family protein [Gaiellaceae bacterium]
MRDLEVREHVEQVEELLGAIEDDVRAVAAVRALVELYGEGLRRIADRGGVTEELAGDELVSHLLLVHDLHPVDVETRVARALEEVRPYLGSHGGDVELVGVSGGVARLRLNGTCDGCPSSSVTLKHSIETAIMRAAPELVSVEAEGLDERPSQLLQIAPGPCLPARTR